MNHNLEKLFIMIISTFVDLQRFTVGNIPPKDYLIGHKLEGVNILHGIKAKLVLVYDLRKLLKRFITLRKILKRFFELFDAFESTISYIESLKNDLQYVHIKFYSNSTVETQN